MSSNKLQDARVRSTTPAKTATDSSEPAVEEFIGEVSRQISPILPAGQRDQVIARITAVVKREAFQGPIAHPQHLEHYEKVCPGAADRIIAMAEKEQDARTSWVANNQTNEHADKRRGMYCGLAAFFGLIAAAVFCGWMKLPILGGSFLATGVLGAVGLFINGRKNSNGNGD